MTSWEFFDYHLEKANIVGTPGSGFGAHGEGFFRLTAFGTHENTLEDVYKRQEYIFVHIKLEAKYILTLTSYYI